MSADRLKAIIAAHQGREGPLLPILNDVQAAFGAIDEASVRTIAQALNLTRAEVHGVVSFYHDYRSEPASRPVVKLCGAEACQARGAQALRASLPQAVADRVEIETVYCLGLCSVGPAALVGTTPFARLDADRLTQLIGALA